MNLTVELDDGNESHPLCFAGITAGLGNGGGGFVTKMADRMSADTENNRKTEGVDEVCVAIVEVMEMDGK